MHESDKENNVTVNTVEVTPSSNRDPDLGFTHGEGLISALGVGGVSLAIWQVARLLVRRFVKDTTEITKDRAETNIIEVLQQDNKNLHLKHEALSEKYDILSKERNDAVSQLGRFLAESEIYKEKITELQSHILSMSSKIEEQNELLKAVLGENAHLKAQVEHLEKSNVSQGKEIETLREAIKGLTSSSSV